MLDLDDELDGAQGAILCWLATADASGQPNVSPKEVFAKGGEDTLLIADIASPNSVRNIRENPRVSVSLLDVFRQKGLKITGSAELVAADSPVFEALSAPLRERVGDRFKLRHVIVVRIEQRQPVIAPSYLLDPHKDERAMMAESYATYGVRPAKTS